MTELQNEFVFLPLGGVGEIGMNLNLYGFGSETKKQWIIVDYGVSFNDPEAPGMEVFMADPQFLYDNKEDILGLVLTHGHEDHIGAVHHIWPEIKCPIFSTPFTSWLLRDRLKGVGFSEPPIREIPLGGRFHLGPFDLQYLTVTHSIPEPNALIIRTPSGTALHTGDWKIDMTPQQGEAIDIEGLKSLENEDHLTMLCDSTNAISKGRSGSEKEVREALTTLVSKITGGLAIAAFASNLARIESCMLAAKENNRKICIVGRSIKRMIRAAIETGVMKEQGFVFLSEKEAFEIDKRDVLYLCTGSQGEPRAALSRIASDGNRFIKLGQGDTVLFSSKIIPGNETSIFSLHNRLSELGVKIITEKDHAIHVSGHPYQDELKDMYQWVKPKLCIPVHGEKRHLIEHAQLAEMAGVPKTIIPQNGDVIRLGFRSEIIDQVFTGRIFQDGNLILSSDSKAAFERRKLSWAGQLFIHLILDSQGNSIIEPIVKAKGLPDSLKLSLEDLLSHLGDFAEKELMNMDYKDRIKSDDSEIKVKNALRRELKRIWGKKPFVDVAISVL